ncbi:hypothetical protein B0T18DRAFT_386133 [Schizothecium vesticola]|uniref:BTB domain-containing protein n=1 Tax=Schizothecium vesticola TaxID=314040 RepID=A0AA40KCJ7_9PEZI|nr:hypothetical protein B0T18DRAFT_386133 [Schizothecium vesticola]
MTPSPDRESELARTRKEKKSKKPSYVARKRAASPAAASSATMATGSIAGPSTGASSTGPSGCVVGSLSAAGPPSAGPSASGLSLAGLSLADSSSSAGPSSSSAGLSKTRFLAPFSAHPSLVGSSSAGPSAAGPSAPMASSFSGLSATAPSFPGPPLAGSSAGPSSSAGEEASLDSARLVQAKRTVAIIRAHDEGRLKLWGTGISHDVVVECRGHAWKCHYEILTRECKWFSENDAWYDDREGRVITLGMDNHDPVRLGYCLRFMYEKAYDFGTFQPDDPLSVNNIRTNVFMYNCGSSINYQNLMDYTVRNLYQYGRDLKPFLDTLPPAANHLPAGFVAELRITLSETVGHNENAMIFFSLRTAVASIMESILPWLCQHPSFCAATKDSVVWIRLLAQVETDIKQMNELGHVYGDGPLSTYVFAPPPES